MDQGPLVTEEIEAGAELVRKFDQVRPVKAAFWLKLSDKERRDLYLASDRIDDTNFVVAYGEVLELMDQMRTPYLDLFRVKVINGDDPLALAAVDLQRRFPGSVATRLPMSLFGGHVVDDVYIYPPLHAEVP